MATAPPTSPTTCTTAGPSSPARHGRRRRGRLRDRPRDAGRRRDVPEVDQGGRRLRRGQPVRRPGSRPVPRRPARRPGERPRRPRRTGRELHVVRDDRGAHLEPEHGQRCVRRRPEGLRGRRGHHPLHRRRSRARHGHRPGADQGRRGQRPGRHLGREPARRHRSRHRRRTRTRLARQVRRPDVPGVRGWQERPAAARPAEPGLGPRPARPTSRRCSGRRRRCRSARTSTSRPPPCPATARECRWR